MCHRPRTQRIGEDSMPRELFVFEGGKEEAESLIFNLRMAHKKMLSVGYPWKHNKVRDFKFWPNDRFYLVVVE